MSTKNTRAATLYLKHDLKMKAFRIKGTKLYCGPANSDEFDDVAEFLGRKLCDNPAVQAELGVLGVETVYFERP